MAIDSTFIEERVRRLKRRGWTFAPGLTDAEVDRIERRYGFRFPPDLRLLHQIAMPIADGNYHGHFPNWRDGPAIALRRWLEIPYEGLCLDVEWEVLWPAEWGERPDSSKERAAIVRQAVAAAPALIPIYGMRFMPAEPNESGNPVYFVSQAQLTIVGRDLADYLFQEFGGPRPEDSPRPKQIRFWSQFVDQSTTR